MTQKNEAETTNPTPGRTAPTTDGHAEPTSTRRKLVPRADIFETEGSFTLLADMPGVDDKSVEVTVKQNVLTISSENRTTGREGYRRVYAEFEPADFYRAFQLSSDVDAAKIKATVKNGVLRVVVSKAEPAHRRIPVHTS